MYFNTFATFSESLECKIYFSTDGTKPNPFCLKKGGRETTFKYKGPFTLKSGKRTLKVIAVSRLVSLQRHIFYNLNYLYHYIINIQNCTMNITMIRIAQQNN